tara:strand:+ start:23558 stop:23938 length:381 start_codon:yes stop_codon:yes gene_type:complete
MWVLSAKQKYLYICVTKLFLMPRKRKLIVFSIISLLLVISKLTFVITQNSLDVSETFSNSEGEKRIEKHLDFDILLSLLKSNNSQFFVNSKKSALTYVFKRYSKPHLNIISPTPRFLLTKFLEQNA